MKKLYTSAIAAVLLAGMLAGCGGEIDDDMTLVDVTPTLPTIAATTEATTTEITTEPATTTVPETEPVTTTTPATTKKPKPQTTTTRKPVVTTKKPVTTTAPITTTTPMTTTTPPITTTPEFIFGEDTLYTKPTPDPWFTTTVPETQETPWWDTGTAPTPPPFQWETEVDNEYNDQRAEEVYAAVATWSMNHSFFFTPDEREDLPLSYWGRGTKMKGDGQVYELSNEFYGGMDGYWYVKMRSDDRVVVDYVIWCASDFSDTSARRAQNDPDKGYYKNDTF